jgi:hypothetical protein
LQPGFNSSLGKSGPFRAAFCLWETYAGLKRPLFHGWTREGKGRKQAEWRTGEDARHSIEICGRESNYGQDVEAKAKNADERIRATRATAHSSAAAPLRNDNI